MLTLRRACLCVMVLEGPLKPGKNSTPSNSASLKYLHKYYQ